MHPCTALVLKATGKEKVEWRESHSETDSDGNTHTKSEEYEDEKEFFKQKVRTSSSDFALLALRRLSFTNARIRSQ